MKRLLLMRHAEAGSDGPTDLERSLTERGASAALSIGEMTVAGGFRPQLIVSSNANRAIQTAMYFKEGAQLNIDIAFDERIYEAAPHTLFHIAAEFSDAFDTAMMVGHNPGVEGFVISLTGLGQPMRAGALAIIDLKNENWKAACEGGGTLVEVLQP